MSKPFNKSELRKALRERRRAISGTQHSQAGTAAADHLQALPAWNHTQHLALYLPADGEIDTSRIVERARAAAVALYLPVLDRVGVMHFALWEPGARLEENRYGIPEPGPQHPLRAADQLDMVLMPLVGWSKSGERLGMGGGFYDRTLAGISGPLRVGLGFECQRVDQLPTESWDIPMDFVVTEAALHQCGEQG
jgi:5-formyltetrahydrofolate cyclo-ligase